MIDYYWREQFLFDAKRQKHVIDYYWCEQFPPDAEHQMIHRQMSLQMNFLHNNHAAFACCNNAKLLVICNEMKKRRDVVKIFDEGKEKE